MDAYLYALFRYHILCSEAENRSDQYISTLEPVYTPYFYIEILAAG